MKKTTLFLLSALTTFIMYGQDITGQWNGILKVSGMQLRVVFNIKKTDNGYSSTMDSPDQGAKGIPVTTTTFENSKLKLEIANAKIEYFGELKDNVITGTFKQGGQEISLNLSREQIEKQIIKRPQEPTKPYPYYSEDLTFKNNKANIILAGTLTLPQKEGKYPVVILITGSGPQNRDEELLGHKPFLVISDYLTKNGIAVFRYDDRGVAQSKGDFKTATTVDFASDVESAVSYLKTRKDIDIKKIGLVGHSEGGIIAPIVASKSSDIHFIVLLAGSGLSGDKLMLLQKAKIEHEMGYDEKEISKSQDVFKGAYQIILHSETNDINLKNNINTYFKQMLGNNIPEEQVNAITNQIVNPWMINFIKYDPAPVLQKVKCPVLAMNGEKDLQVPTKENLTIIENSLKEGGNKKVTIKIFPNLNHLFQECQTGLPTEYATIEQTFSPIALDFMTKWIVNQVK
jgi:pimeloyl-ACP methyl ester carboxylesterase